MFSLRKISVALLIVFSVLPLKGSNPFLFRGGAVEAGMGMVCLTGVDRSTWQSFVNQATLANNDSFTASINYLSRFNIQELGTRSIAMTIPAGECSLGAIYSHFGYADFRRTMSGLALGMSLSENLSAGVQIDYFAERSYGEYGNRNSITFELGAIFAVNDRIRTAVHLFNPLPNSLRTRYLPSTVSAGIGTDLTETLMVAMELELSSTGMFLFRTGCQYEVFNRMWMRTGYCTDNNSFSLGVGYLFSPLKIDLAVYSHEVLGLSSSLSLTYSFK